MLPHDVGSVGRPVRADCGADPMVGAAESSYRLTRGRAPAVPRRAVGWHTGSRLRGVAVRQESGTPIELGPDPHTTDPFARAEPPSLPETGGLPFAEYDFATATLTVVQGDRRAICHLGPKRQRLVWYMVSQNLANEGVPVACRHDDLIHAVWGPPEAWPVNRAFTRVNLADLVFELRKQLDPHRHLLETVWGIGYRLRARCSTVPRERRSPVLR